jgi:hypothetical protein
MDWELKPIDRIIDSWLSSVGLPSLSIDQEPLIQVAYISMNHQQEPPLAVAPLSKPAIIGMLTTIFGMAAVNTAIALIFSKAAKP